VTSLTARTLLGRSEKQIIHIGGGRIPRRGRSGSWIGAAALVIIVVELIRRLALPEPSAFPHPRRCGCLTCSLARSRTTPRGLPFQHFDPSCPSLLRARGSDDRTATSRWWSTRELEEKLRLFVQSDRRCKSVAATCLHSRPIGARTFEGDLFARETGRPPCVLLLQDLLPAGSAEQVNH